MKKARTYIIIGGDERFAKLAELLREDGDVALTENCGDERASGEDVASCNAVSEIVVGAAGDADCVVLPLPFEWNENVMRRLSRSQVIFAGRVSSEDAIKARERGLVLHDYFAREEMAILNAIATAEGAVEIVMRETAYTLWGANVLVIGFGRIGKVLANRLTAVGASVTVSARSCADHAWISAYGYKNADTLALGEAGNALNGYDIVINTVPSRVLDAERLKRLKDGCLVVDLASKPGGIDFKAAAELGINAHWALSLPGKVAPLSSAKIIRDTIRNMERELQNKDK
jgi:dipicolinate synthase subunit A